MAMAKAATEPDLEEAISQYMSACLSERSVPRVAELADILGVSPVQLHRILTNRGSPTAIRALHARQLDAAKQLLLTTDLTISEVARAAAYGSARSFHRAFRRLTDMSPGDFRRKNVPRRRAFRGSGSAIPRKRQSNRRKRGFL